MNHHEGVNCDSCLKRDFRGRRYKCLLCYDYDLCPECYESSEASARHVKEHPFQCIITRADMSMYFGGEIINPSVQQSFTCPLCCQMGFSESSLIEHVAENHVRSNVEVICPICAGSADGEPNLFTDDFLGHLNLRHRREEPQELVYIDHSNTAGPSQPSAAARTNKRVTVRGHSVPKIVLPDLSLEPPSSTEPTSTMSPFAEFFSHLAVTQREPAQPVHLNRSQALAQSLFQGQTQASPLNPPQPDAQPRTNSLLGSHHIQLQRLSRRLQNRNQSKSSERPRTMPTFAELAAPGLQCRRDSTSGAAPSFSGHTDSILSNALDALIANHGDNLMNEANADSSPEPVEDDSANFLLPQLMRQAEPEPSSSVTQAERMRRTEFVQSLLCSFLSTGTLPTDRISRKPSEAKDEVKVNIDNNNKTSDA